MERVSQEALIRQEQELRARRREAVERVEGLAARHRELGGGLDAEVEAFVAQGRALDEIDAAERDSGVLGGLVRRFNQRRLVLERRSVSEQLIEKYERVGERLQRASAFTDELRLCALEMQAEVDRLHADLARDIDAEKAAAERILAIEAELDALEDADVPDVERDRRRDALVFEERSLALELSLHEAAVRLWADGLGPARALRDGVQQLHAETARYVLRCGDVVREAGVRIQALGTAADAPVVVGELQASLRELETAVKATERYLEHNRDLVGRVLPELSRGLDAPGLAGRIELPAPSEAISRVTARDQAEHALRAAAAAELAELLGD